MRNNWRLTVKLYAQWIARIMVFVFWMALGLAVSMGMVRLIVDAMIWEVNNDERTALDHQGREAWDAYCDDVFVKLARPDDLDAIYAECSALEWDRSHEQ